MGRRRANGMPRVDGSLRRVREGGDGVGGAVGWGVLFMCEERGLVVKC
jgi:hypothetical protein